MKKLDFVLRDHYIELNKLLKLCGLCDSGGAGKAIVESGQIKVNGKVELRKTYKVTAGNIIDAGSVQIRVLEK